MPQSRGRASYLIWGDVGGASRYMLGKRIVAANAARTANNIG